MVFISIPLPLRHKKMYAMTYYCHFFLRLGKKPFNPAKILNYTGKLDFAHSASLCQFAGNPIAALSTLGYFWKSVSSFCLKVWFGLMVLRKYIIIDKI